MFYLTYLCIHSSSSFLIIQVKVVLFFVFVTVKFVLSCSILKLNAHYFAKDYNLGQKFPCPYITYRWKAIYSTQLPSSSAHEYVGRKLSAQRKLTDFYLEVGFELFM